MPEWPNGTALKAVADRNASRGFESRPLCVNSPSKYRLGRAHRLMVVGAAFVVAAVAVMVAFAVRSSGVGFGIALGIAAVVALAAIALLLIGPVVVIVDADGFRARIRSGGPRTIAWADVEEVDTADGLLVLTNTAGDDVRFPLAMVEPAQRTPLLREVHDRLNTANGYRRL